MVNEEGGILGRYPIKYKFGDAQSDPAVAASETERLITVEGCKIIVGFYSSALALSASEVCERYKIICWSLGEVSDEITTRGYNYTFACTNTGSMMPRICHFPFMDEVVAPALGVSLSSLKVAIVYEDGPYGTSCAMGDRACAQARNMQIVFDEGYSSKSTDLSSLITKLKASNPDILLITAYVSDAILFFKQAKELGFKTKLIFGHGGGTSVPAFAEALGDDVNGIFGGGAPAVTYINTMGFPEETRKLADEFVSYFTTKWGYPPVEHAGIGFSHIWPLLKYVIPEAIEKYGGYTVENIRKAALDLDLPVGSLPNGMGMKFCTWDNPWIDPSGKKHVQRNINTFLPMSQWINRTIYVVWPQRLSKGANPVVPLPPTSPYYRP